MTDLTPPGAPRMRPDLPVHGPMLDGPRRVRIADERGTDRRAQVAAARRYADELRARRRAGEAAHPAGEWATRERAALDALGALAAFLDNHPTNAVAQAVVHAAHQQQTGVR